MDFLLRFLSFYHIDEITLSSETDWYGIFFTALLSGVVAWGAAALQITMSSLAKGNEEKEDSYNLILMCQNSFIKSIDVIDSQLAYLIRSIKDSDYKKLFDISDSTINTASVQAVLSVEFTSFYKCLKNVFPNSPGDIEAFVSAYFSLHGFLKSYEELRTFYKHKLREYNRTLQLINDSNHSVALLTQNLIFSKSFLSKRREINKLYITERHLARKSDPEFYAIHEINRVTFEFQQKKDSSFPALESYLLQLEKKIEEGKEYFPSVELAQAVQAALTNLKSMRSFYDTLKNTYEKFYETTEEQKNKVSLVSKLAVKVPKKDRLF